MKAKISEFFRKEEKFDFESNIYIKISICIISVFIISLLLPSFKNDISDFEIGNVWSNEDLIAPFSFPIYKDEKEYEQEKSEVIQNISPVFVDSGDLTGEVLDFYSSFISSLTDILKKTNKSVPDINQDISIEKKSMSIEFDEDKWKVLENYYKDKDNTYASIPFNDLSAKIKQTLNNIQQNRIINLDKGAIKSQKVSIKKESLKYQTIEDIDKIYDKKEVMNIFNSTIYPYIKDTTLRTIVTSIADKFIIENLIYNKDLTELEIKNRIEQIPKTIGIVRENERIVSKHEPITRMIKIKLDSYKKVQAESMGLQDIVKQYIGRLLTVILLVAIFFVFIFLLRKKIFYSNSKLILIFSLVILISFFAYLSMHIRVDYPVELLIFVPVVSILLTILFDSRISFTVTTMICFLLGAIRGGDFATSYISFCGSVLAIFSVRDIENRALIFRSAYYIFAGYIVAIAATSLVKIYYSKDIVFQMIFGGINSLMSPIIAYGLLFFYEKTFRITTNLTLLELADFNHPLLKKLSTLAPGTFHHSIVMGNLAEAAAESIGANRILARVGCYYHDIGKMVKPEYFVENQIEQKNKHENLNPNISAKVIISHVKDGIELAEKYHLPKEVIDFIPMHHGTTLVSYFYNKAKNMTDKERETISDYIYRYPGPKPQTKETGIVMIADIIESSTRTIEDPTPSKLEDRIDEIIKKRFIEGELDECDLTLKDLTKIKIAFLKILIGIHHQRIKYPDDAFKTKK